jgi:hypothetical protein
MECTLAALVACFSWGGFFIDGGLAWQDAGVPRTDYREVIIRRDDGFQYRAYDDFVVYDKKNPYAFGALGYEIRFRALSISLEAAHRSSAVVGYDDGVNSVLLRARWFPFRRR